MTAEYPGNENNQKIISNTHDSERNLRYILTYNKWDSIIWGGSQFYIHIDRRCNDKYDQRREKDRISNHIGSKISIYTGLSPELGEEIQRISNQEHIGESTKANMFSSFPYYNNE